MALVPQALASQARCKLCASPKRAEAELAIASWKSREMSREAMLERLAELGIENPNLDNVKGHTGTEKKPKHVRFIDADQAEKDAEFESDLEEARAAEGQAILERVCPNWRTKTPSVDEVLELQRALYVWELNYRLERGKDIGLTHDHALKGGGEATKRKSSDVQNELLGAFADGIGQVFEKALGPAPKELPEIVEHEPVDVDVADVDADDVDVRDGE